MQSEFLDAEFLKNYVQHTEDVITLKSFGNMKVKVKKMSAAQSKILAKIILDEFGEDNVEKYYADIEYILNKYKDLPLESEKKVKELLGDKYDLFANASINTLVYTISCCTGLDYEDLKKLDEAILIEMNQEINNVFSIDNIDIKKK